ncbi:hypothetical protein AB0E63_17110 [Kribbella sp. NPDC026596]|uniref:hypothetical protein n=1 Tax=Kribbella sp. NPDC026596 TaxID=3155122 RepID=UPI0033E40575
MTIDSFTEHAHGNHSDRPDPALTPLTRAQAARLVRLCLTTTAELGLEVTYKGDAALVPVTPTPSSPILGLSNLARTLSRYGEHDWPALIKEHFTQILQQLRHGPPDPPTDPERQLIQRLVPRHALPDNWTADRPDFVPGLVSVPATVNEDVVTMYLNPPDFGLTWSTAEHFGLSNLRRLTDHVEYVEHDDIRLALITGTSFTASRALVLDTVLRESLHLETPPHGLLVSFPTRDILLIHVIQNLSLIPALGLLLNLTARSHTHDRSPLSPEVHLALPTTPTHPATTLTTGACTTPAAEPNPISTQYTWHPATTASVDHTPLRLSPELESLTKLLATQEPPPPPP